MCPLSDDALLDWVLFPKEADPELVRHLRDCRSCEERSLVVLREQGLLQIAFQEPVRIPRRADRVTNPRGAFLGSRIGVAALVLLSVGVGALISWSAHAPSRRSHGSSLSRVRQAPLGPIVSDLSVMAQKIAAARDTLGGAEDEKASSTYLELLSQEEELYIDGMEHYLSEQSALSPDQEENLRGRIRNFYALNLSPEDVGEASRTFRDQVRALLNEKQYQAFEEFSRQGTDWQWKTAIALLVVDLCLELDLRFSEGERVRRTLELNYPRVDLPVLCGDRCPPDPMVDNPTLCGAVRNSLDASHLRKFETYLGHVKIARDRALKITRQHQSPK
jgi:hypothetical protein